MKKLIIGYLIFWSIISAIAVTANNTDSCKYQQKKRQSYREYSSKNYKGLKAIKITIFADVKIKIERRKVK